MRITNHFATEQAIRTFGATREQLDAALQQVSTGRRITTASDDPMGARLLMQYGSETRSVEQMQRTIDAASARLGAEETGLNQLNDILIRARELAVAQASDTSNPTTRQAVAAEANQLLAQAVQIANTQHDRQYLFGGRAASTAPFTIDITGPVYTFTAATPPAQGGMTVSLGAQSIAASHDGSAVFGDTTSGALASLQALATALNAGATPGVAATIDGIDAALQTTQVLVAETGAWTNRLDMARQATVEQTEQIESATTALRDVDIEDAMTRLVGRQTAFQAAMAATARIFGLSLTDYLR
jgi:flagellar hook-associated protein 3 FlgL